MIAALYIDKNSPYLNLSCSARGGEWLQIDCWDLTRDARKYSGPHPVVAHPPCGPWSKQRANYRGLEHDCAPRAVEQVRRWGGVLEHPAGSLLWNEALTDGVSRARWTLPPAEGGNDPYGGYTIAVDQVEWGHVARKRTWLYLVGVPREALEAPPLPGREPTHWVSGGRTKSSRKGSPVPPGIKVCSAQQRRRTPPLFAEYLVRLAEAARK